MEMVERNHYACAAKEGCLYKLKDFFFRPMGLLNFVVRIYFVNCLEFNV
jgi:hypothetical protein